MKIWHQVILVAMISTMALTLASCSNSPTELSTEDTKYDANALEYERGAQGTILRTNSLLGAARGDDLLLRLCGQDGDHLQLARGTTIHIGGRNTGCHIAASWFEIRTDDRLYEELIEWLNREFPLAGCLLMVELGSSGELRVTNFGGTDVIALSLYTPGNSAFNMNFMFPDLPGGETVSSAPVLAFACTDIHLADLYSWRGQPLELPVANGPQLQITAQIGRHPIRRHTMLIEQMTEIRDLLIELENILDYDLGQVTMDDQGRIVVRGNPGLASEIRLLDIHMIGVENIPNQQYRRIAEAFSFRQIQAAGFLPH